MKCECGNDATEGGMCDWCANAADEPPHTGHWSVFGTYWCDTCNSALCNLI